MRYVVNAKDRGDLCFKDRKGWFHYELDAQAGIATDSIKGPFRTEWAARDDVLWSIFREQFGPRPAGHHDQERWTAEWDYFRNAATRDQYVKEA